MIKRAGKEDAKKVMSYLEIEGSLNTTLLAHIEKYGFEKEFQDIWLHLDEHEEKTLAVVMRHFNSLYIYSEGCVFENDELGSFASFLGSDIISGKLDLLSDLALYVEGMFLEPSCHMKLHDGSMLVPCTEVQKAELSDCQELAALIYSIPEFSRFYHSRLEIEKGIRRRMELGICRYFVLKRDGVIVSQAYTTIESSRYATIGGVVTRHEYRKQGLASLVVSCICHNLLEEKKIPNLFYSNEEAGRVYQRLGFAPAGEYAMLLAHKYRIT